MLHADKTPVAMLDLGARNMVNEWDPDIAAMKLTDVEKNGLQVYRNYQRSFEEHGRLRFINAANSESYSTQDLEKFLGHLATIEPRSIPVVTCAFADDELGRMFRREIPADVPGGRGDLLTGYGSLSRLSQRVQIAHAFNWLSSEITIELNLLRKLRNEISHKWDVEELEQKIEELVLRRQQKVEVALLDYDVDLVEHWGRLNLSDVLRVRTIWITTRMFYECQLWAKAVKERLEPSTTLYGTPRTKLLEDIVPMATELTMRIVRSSRP